MRVFTVVLRVHKPVNGLHSGENKRKREKKNGGEASGT